MQQTITAMYDGEVLRPDEPVRLQPNSHYRITIEETKEKANGQNLWEFLKRTTGTIEGPKDWSAEHDHYLYGVSKRREEKE
ncbi:MAG: antitoxin family protein [Ignavibacteriae bacterium]|nr:antitoxin family protein [Ignavibacteriota bacterium]